MSVSLGNYVSKNPWTRIPKATTRLSLPMAAAL